MSSYFDSCFDSPKEYVKTGVGGSRLGVGQEQRISFTMQVVSCKNVVGGRWSGVRKSKRNWLTVLNGSPFAEKIRWSLAKRRCTLERAK